MNDFSEGRSLRHQRQVRRRHQHEERRAHFRRDYDGAHRRAAARVQARRKAGRRHRRGHRPDDPYAGGHPAMERVDTIEIEPAMAEASRLFAPINSNAFADRAATSFRRCQDYFSTHNRLYDIIVSEPSNPLGQRRRQPVHKRVLPPCPPLPQAGGRAGAVVPALRKSTFRWSHRCCRHWARSFPDYVIYASTNSDLLIVAGEARTLARPLADVTAMRGFRRSWRACTSAPWGRRDTANRRQEDAGAILRQLRVPANPTIGPTGLNAARYRYLQQSAATSPRSGRQCADRGHARRPPAPHAPTLDGEEYLDRIENTRRAHYARGLLLATFRRSRGPFRHSCRKTWRSCAATWSTAAIPSDSTSGSLAVSAGAHRQPLPLRGGRRRPVGRLGAAPCAMAVPPAKQAWIELFGAVASRDAIRMAALAEQLLAQTSDLPRSNRQYLITAE